jgi:copper chaperone NosL
MNLLRSISMLSVFVLSGCGGEPEKVALPREPGPGAIGHYCRMTLAEHKGPKGQILPRGWEEPVWFSSVRDALTYVEQDIVSERELAGFWVNDMAQGTWDKPAPGSWIDARAAWFVVGSSKSSGMGGREAVPFKERGPAEAFAKANGGEVVDYAQARRTAGTEQPMGETSQEDGT